MEGPSSEPRTEVVRPPEPDVAGSEELSYSDLFQRYLPRTLGWLAQRGVPERHLLDVAQEAWIRVFRSFDTYDPERPFEPWLATIVFRSAANHRRKLSERRERLSETGEVDPEEEAPPSSGRAIDATRTLRKLLSKLPPEQQEIVILAELEEMDQTEIAAILGLKVNTVYSRLARARATLQEEAQRFVESERRKRGAAWIVPLFLVDLRALFEGGRELSEVSPEIASRLWGDVQRGLAADGGAAPPPAVPPPAAQPPAVSRGVSSGMSPVRRLPASPLLRGGLLVLGGALVGGAGMLLSTAPPARVAPTIAQEQPPSAIAPAAIAPASTESARAAAGLSAAPSVTVRPYDGREELAVLEAAYALYFQGKCEAARAKLSTRSGHVHAKDYAELRKKIDACLAKNGGPP